MVNFLQPGGDDKNLGEYCLGKLLKMNRFNILNFAFFSNLIKNFSKTWCNIQV